MKNRYAMLLTAREKLPNLRKLAFVLRVDMIQQRALAVRYMVAMFAFPFGMEVLVVLVSVKLRLGLIILAGDK